MMQKRKSYLSLLLASFLLLFTYSFATAQTYEISFEDKTVPRCVTADMSVYVTNDEPLGAFEIIFEVGGDFDSYDVTMSTLPMSTFLELDGNIARLSGFKGDDPGDECLPADVDGQVVATIHFETSDECNGTITVVAATVDDPFTHGSNFVGCDYPFDAIVPTFVNGELIIANQMPSITCPTIDPVHFGDVVIFDVIFGDADVANLCENLTFTLEGDSPEAADIDPSNGHVVWPTSGDDVCWNEFTIRVTDKCQDWAECIVDICVQNDPPVFGDEMMAGWMNDADPPEQIYSTGWVDVTSTIYTVMGIKLIGDVEATDDDDGPSDLNFTILSFDGPTDFGDGLEIVNGTGEWSWDIADNDMDYAGDFELCLLVSDGAATCEDCSPENADTLCLDIHVTGYGIVIENEDGGEDTEHKGVIQGTTATVSVLMQNPDLDKVPPYDPIGGFDFLISYDPTALTALKAEAGELVDTEFEYFTYRLDPLCAGGGCPTGMIQVVGMRESNDGVINTAPPVTGPGELVKLFFRVSEDLTLGCQFVPIRFFWRDCSDNTLSDESGNILYLGLHVYDFEGTEITDPTEYGYSGPMDYCYEVVSVDPFKAPLGAILFQNGGIKIICPDDIDDRGDINLNGIRNEVADAVVFTNYFIYGLGAFTINIAGQTAASDVNADGRPLSVADLVYLIRIIVGDALPIGKLIPGDPVTVAYNGQVVDLLGTTDVGAIRLVFDDEVIPSLADQASHMQIKYAHVDGRTNVLLYSMDRGYLAAGTALNIEGRANLVDAEASDYFGAMLEVNNVNVPTDFALHQNYPNPFNPETKIELALPVASDWSLAIYNVSGQKVKEFSGTSEAGVVQVVWDATEAASGIYFYKAIAGNFTDTKKMVLLK